MLKYILWITLWMIRIMDGWLERADGEWEVVDVTSTNEENEPCNSSLTCEDCEEMIEKGMKVNWRMKMHLLPVGTNKYNVPLYPT